MNYNLSIHKNGFNNEFPGTIFMKHGRIALPCLPDIWKEKFIEGYEILYLTGD